MRLNRFRRNVVPNQHPAIFGKTYQRKFLGLAGADLIQYLRMGENAGNDYLTFNGTSTTVNFGSGASLDDLHDDILSGDFWIKPGISTGTDLVMSKSDSGAGTGWHITIDGTNINFRVYDNSGTPTFSQATAVVTVGEWVHISFFFNDAGDRKAYIAKNGTWQTAGNALVAPIGSDAALSLYFGRLASGASQYYTGIFGWVRIQNNDHLGVGVDFTSPARTTIPEVDANTVSLWPFNENYGTIAGDLGPNGNDGTISNGDWGDYPAVADYSGNSFDGVYVGATLANVAGPARIGGRAPYFDGVNDFVNAHSAGTVLIFAKTPNTDVWSDGLSNLLVQLYADVSNKVAFNASSDGNLYLNYKAGGTDRIVTDLSPASTDWQLYGLTWDVAADEVAGYKNGVQLGSTLNSLGTWAGSLLLAVVGAANVTPTTPFGGWLMEYALLGRALTDSEFGQLAAWAGVA